METITERLFGPSTTDGFGNLTTSTTEIPTTTPNVTPDNVHFCKWILYEEIDHSRVRIWDLIILIPNCMLMFFLAATFPRARLMLRATNSPIFFTFYVLVILNVVVSVVRCGVSMSVNAAEVLWDYMDKILWVLLRFFLLSTELSVLTFGLAFGHLDSRTSIRRVLIVTSFVSLAFSTCQGALEIWNPDPHFFVDAKNYDLFGHGGMYFWCISSALFATVYWAIYIIPKTRLRNKLPPLPTKKSFYVYVLFLALLNLFQSLGAFFILVTSNFDVETTGLCVVDITTYLYFILLTPLVYRTFLKDIFASAQPGIMFSYKPHLEDHASDAESQASVPLPHQSHSFSSMSSMRSPSVEMPEPGVLGWYDHTRMDSVHSPTSSLNPLYAASLQSPIMDGSLGSFPFVGASLFASINASGSDQEDGKITSSTSKPV